MKMLPVQQIRNVPACQKSVYGSVNPVLSKVHPGKWSAFHEKKFNLIIKSFSPFNYEIGNTSSIRSNLDPSDLIL
jgi:hypothetical protein